jgi:hypothetical protein
MVVMSTSNKISDSYMNAELIETLTKDYPKFIFRSGKQERWSPKSKTITYNPEGSSYGVLHELAHAILSHSTYQSDFELLKMEAEAWVLAAKLGLTYKIKINEDHIQDCLDTYRDWLHKRSTCPTCGAHALQESPINYFCFNCRTSWSVSSERFARSYRKTIKAI